MRGSALLAVVCCVSASGCEIKPTEPLARGGSGGPPRAAAAQHGGHSCGSCAHQRPAKAALARPRERKGPGGVVVTQVGTITDAPEVPVAKLLADPEAYRGKRVRVTGNVAAMCHHRRAWFAITGKGDKSGRHLRVLTAPAFLVPPRSVGKSARAEGTVEIIAVDPAMARHLADSLKLHYPQRERPIKRVVLRASGAEFS